MRVEADTIPDAVDDAWRCGGVGAARSSRCATGSVLRSGTSSGRQSEESRRLSYH